jgi:hypothetical protein
LARLALVITIGWSASRRAIINMLAIKVSPRSSASSMALSMASTKGLFLLSLNIDISSDLMVMPLLAERLKMMRQAAEG